jgi:hypothetical protein
MVLMIYSGTPPASADAVPTGTLLAKITKDGAAVTQGAVSTAQRDRVAVTAGGNGDQFTATVAGTGYTITQDSDDTAVNLVQKLAAAINADLACPASALAVTGTTEKVVMLTAKYAGEGYTLSVSKTGGGTITATNEVANARINSIHFAAESMGSISMEAITAEGVGLADGVATYGRLVHTTDTGAQSSTERRAQGSIGTVGTDIIMGSTTVVTGAKQTVQSITFRVA